MTNFILTHGRGDGRVQSLAGVKPGFKATFAVKLGSLGGDNPLSFGIPASLRASLRLVASLILPHLSVTGRSQGDVGARPRCVAKQNAWRSPSILLVSYKGVGGFCGRGIL